MIVWAIVTHRFELQTMPRLQFRRPRRRQIAAPPEGKNLVSAARRAKYVGSVEHKEVASPAGLPKPRADATICPLVTKRDFARATRWLKDALASGNVGAPWYGAFPRYAWRREGEIVYEAFLVNSAAGEYKGWPLADPSDWPNGLR